MNIEKGIPIPTGQLSRSVRSRYPFEEMKVGDSFAVARDLPRFKGAGDSRGSVNGHRLRHAAEGYAKRHRPKRFLVRTDYEKDEVRCWRVE